MATDPVLSVASSNLSLTLALWSCHPSLDCPPLPPQKDSGDYSGPTQMRQDLLRLWGTSVKAFWPCEVTYLQGLGCGHLWGGDCSAAHRSGPVRPSRETCPWPVPCSCPLGGPKEMGVGWQLPSRAPGFMTGPSQDGGASSCPAASCGGGHVGPKTHFCSKVTSQVILLCVSPSEPRGPWHQIELFLPL